MMECWNVGVVAPRAIGGSVGILEIPITPQFHNSIIPYLIIIIIFVRKLKNVKHEKVTDFIEFKPTYRGGLCPEK